MWIHFNFLSDVRIQIRLHKILRSRITEWEAEFIDGSVLTYHFANPSNRNPHDSLYACLSIPSINPPSIRTIELSDSLEQQLPEQIRNTMYKLASQNLGDSIYDKLEKRDYEYDLVINNASSTYNCPVEGILNFASRGTRTALDILNDYRTREEKWENDKDVATAMKRLVDERLATETERLWGLHFVCNSVFLANIVEGYLRAILDGNIDGRKKWALNFLYEIERSGRIEEAVRNLIPIAQLQRQ